MNLIRSLALAVTVSLLIFAHVATAQQASRPFPLAIDFTVGPNSGRGGEFTDRLGGGFELVVALRHDGAGFGAFTLGGREGVSSSADCVISSGSAGGCARSYPDFIHIGALAGLQGDRGPLSLRGMLGPAYFSGPRTSGFGGQAHIDAAVGVSRVAIVAAARVNAIAGFKGEQFTIGALEAGVRIR